MNKNEIVIFETEDKAITLPVAVGNETVWLNRNQMAELFARDVKTIGKHINNALKEELDYEEATVAKFATVQMEGEREVERQIEYYNLDVIISVGHRVKSKRGVEFRRWANSGLANWIWGARNYFSRILWLSRRIFRRNISCPVQSFAR